MWFLTPCNLQVTACPCDPTQLKPCNHRIISLCCLYLCTWIIVSCGSPRGAVNPEAQLIQQFQRWEGTPYRLGGSSRRGVDCSAFVQIMIRDTYGVTLPRTTREQLEFGQRVNPGAARLGDLVFFQTGRTTYHVGILMRGDFFMHASTSRGVTIDRLREPYWQQRIIEIRRVSG